LDALAPAALFLHIVSFVSLQVKDGYSLSSLGFDSRKRLAQRRLRACRAWITASNVWVHKIKGENQQVTIK
jgi:hypothetical protein